MNAVPVLYAALKAAGVSPHKTALTHEDLEAARLVLRAVDRFLSDQMGETTVVEACFEMKL